MITETPVRWQPGSLDWQQQYRQAITDPKYLLTLLQLPISEQVLTTAKTFGLRVPQSYVARMRPGDALDPLLRQVLPDIQEHDLNQNFGVDPVGDCAAERQAGVLAKYQGRLLLMPTAACAIHCRYCFRRHYRHQPLSYQAGLSAIQEDSSIREVILSGGDPLTLTDEQLAQWLQHLAPIPHLQRLRLHTRLPIVLPARITESLLTVLTATPLQIIIVVHANHANELDDNVCQVLKRLVNQGIMVLNQSVLLRGVNDNIDALIALSEALFRAQVWPYYLHLLDRVQGAAHFEVPLSQAKTLLEQMRVQLPGYLVPKWVREVTGGLYKQPL